MRFIVHTGTGTVLDADDGVLIVEMLDPSDTLTDEDITFYAMRHGKPVGA